MDRPPTLVDGPVDPNDELAVEEQRERREARLATLSLRRQLRETAGVSVALAGTLAEKIEQLRDRDDILIEIDSLAGLEFYRGLPVFRDECPEVGDPRRQLINVSGLNADQRMTWLKMQATRLVSVPFDQNDQRLGVRNAPPAQYQWHGLIWPVRKGRAVAVPWPIAEQVEESLDVEGHEVQYLAYLRSDVTEQHERYLPQ